MPFGMIGEADSVPTARGELSAQWRLPATAMFGIAGAALFAYSSGVFMKPVTHALGWTKVEFSSAFTVMMTAGLIIGPLVGRIVDKIGARRVALAGILPFVLAFASFGLANGSMWLWWLLALGMASASGLVSPTVWITPVVRRFDKARGIALAISLAGMGVASTTGPLLAAALVSRLGWRLAFGSIALIWAVPMAAMTWFWFFEGGGEHLPRRASAKPAPAGPLAADLPRTPLLSVGFFSLVGAGSLFACMSYAISVHLVPMMEQNGLGLGAAASVAATAGFFAIIGRISIGFALDRFPTRLVGVTVVLCPIIVAILLLNTRGAPPMSFLAAAVFGLVNGAEIDVIAYIVAQRFPREKFASTYSIVNAVVSVSASLGPLIAAVIFDAYASYTPFLLVIMPTSLLNAALIWLSTAPASAGNTAIEPALR